MSKIYKAINSIVLMVLFSILSIADNGMWMPHQMKDLNLEKSGLKMNPSNLYKTDGTGLMSAVVHLGGGTGEFVSNKGLILTNHHVAFGAVQKASTTEHNYVKNGFYAENLENEIPAPGYIADVLLHYEDITKTIEKNLDKSLRPLEKFKALDKLKKKLIKKAENKGDDIHCQIKSMYSGNKYFLFTFKRLRDIRLVYIPPKSIGNFGGDIDNWMWPRHTGDFSFLRAYVSKKGVGCEYSKENVPYLPKSYLKLSLKGLNNGDFTFVMGYPGRTYRNMTYYEVKESVSYMKKRVKLYKSIINFIEKERTKNETISIKYARIVKGLNNTLKNYLGKLEGFKKSKLVFKKKELEYSFVNNGNNKSLQKTLNALTKHMKETKNFDEKSNNLNRLTSSYTGSAMLSQAYLLARYSLEMKKPDIERESGYQIRDIPSLKNRMKYSDRGFEFEVDKKFFKFNLIDLSKISENYWPDEISHVLKGGETSINTFVNNLYDNTKIKQLEVRMNLFGKSEKELKKLNDPFINFAFKLENKLKKYREKRKALNQMKNDMKKEYMKSVLNATNGNIAPDANSSIRFTSGVIKGYTPKDAVKYTPFTTLKGVIEKETGEEPFIVPTKLKKLFYKKDFGNYIDNNNNEIVTCFLNTTNVTGGNSGSPVLNGKGEQIGIVFDMTYESVIGDYYIIPELQRTIHVDIRYVLFITDKFGNAKRIINEVETVK